MPSYRYRRGDERWELTLIGTELRVERHSNGAPPTSETTKYGEEIAARWALDSQIAEFIASGAVQEYCTNDGVELSEPCLEKPLLAEPTQIDGYLVYGDWLLTHGEPRGELIAVQHAQMSPRANSSALARAELTLLARHRERFFGRELAEVSDIATQRYEIDKFQLDWHMGFLRRVALPCSPTRAVPRLANASATPGTTTTPTPRNLGATWRQLLASPSARFLREIVCDWADLEEIGGGAPATLASIEISFERWWAPEREEEALLADDGHLPLEDVLGPAIESAPMAHRALHLLLASAPPSLTVLGLAHSPFSRELLRALLEAPEGLLQRLEVLALPWGSLNDEDAALVAPLLGRAPRLQTLDLRRNRFSNATRIALIASDKRVLVS